MVEALIIVVLPYAICFSAFRIVSLIQAGRGADTDKHQAFDPVEEITVKYRYDCALWRKDGDKKHAYYYDAVSESGIMNARGGGGFQTTPRKALKAAKKALRQDLEATAKARREQAEFQRLRKTPVTETIRMKVE